MSKRALYIGNHGGERVVLDGDHLTTHAVCLGMTGSGKTGLGIVVLEELARRGVPLLVVDLKGDMVDLLLQFPSLAAEEFAPWLPPGVEGDRAAAAERAAAAWREGLSRSGLGPGDVAAVAGGLRWQLVTPGLASGAPLDVLPALSPPPGWNPDADPDGARDRVNAVTSALLSLVGRGGDPLSDRDQVLVASVLLALWRRGDRLDLPGLLAALADPPFERLGVLPLETVHPRRERMELVLALNTLLASPAFGAWTRGLPLAAEELLGVPGKPRGTIVTLAHLDERQRLFALALLAGELASWMRRQPASDGLRCLLYVDEVHGILPPHPASPPTKPPLLTLLKQGRAFGVGTWLATQNPVDIDYKALGNAGVKVIGRLVTDRDRDRALEGLGLRARVDGEDVDDLVAGLGKREFLLEDVRARERVRRFSSRWAMSYLRGPVTVAELGPLLAKFAPGGGERPGPAATSRGPARPASAADSPGPAPGARPVSPPGGPASRETAGHPPVLGADLPVRFEAGGEGDARPALLFRCRLTVERRSLGLHREIEETWLVPGTDGGLDWDGAERVEQRPALVEDPPPGMRFPAVVPPALARDLRRAEKAAVSWRARRPVSVLANRALRLAAEPGEDRDAFLERCLEEADRADDARQEKVRRRFERRLDTVRRRLAREKEELERDRRRLEALRAEEKLGVVEGLFSVLLGSRSLRSAAGKAGTRLRGAATKRRMRQQAEGAVEESVGEIGRLEEELDRLAGEMQEEIDAIAARSEEKARRIEEVPVRPKRADVVVDGVTLAWLAGA